MSDETKRRLIYAAMILGVVMGTIGILSRFVH
jgi:hypothetical protein